MDIEAEGRKKERKKAKFQVWYSCMLCPFPILIIINDKNKRYRKRKHCFFVHVQRVPFLYSLGFIHFPISLQPVFPIINENERKRWRERGVRMGDGEE